MVCNELPFEKERDAIDLPLRPMHCTEPFVSHVIDAIVVALASHVMTSIAN